MTESKHIQTLDRDIIGEIKSALDTAKLMERFYDVKIKNKRAKCPWCGSKDSRLIVDRHHYHCFGASCPSGKASGDVIDLIGIKHGLSDFKDKLQHGCEYANLDWQGNMPLKRRDSYDNAVKKSKADAAKLVNKDAWTASMVRPVVMRSLWDIVQNAPITKTMRMWCQQRKLDKQLMYELGMRDWYAVYDELSAYIDTLSEDERQATGLVNGEGKLWWPIRRKQGRLNGIAIPCVVVDGIPQAYRWRFERPPMLQDGARAPKSLSQPQGTSAHRWHSGLMYHPGNAPHVVIVEGEPDYLTMQSLTQQMNVDVIGLCGSHANGLQHLLSGYERITIATHQDRHENGEAKQKIENQKVMKVVAAWAQDRPDVMVNVLNIDGKYDINDMHQSGDCTWLVEAIQRPDHTTPLTVEFSRLLDAQSDASVQKRRSKTIATHGNQNLGHELTREQTQVRVQNAVRQAIENNTNLGIIAKAGSGKTHITILETLKALAINPDMRAMVVVPTHGLAQEQMEFWRNQLNNTKIDGISRQQALLLDNHICKTKPYHSPESKAYQNYLRLQRFCPSVAQDFAKERRLFRHDELYHERLNNARLVFTTHERFVKCPPPGDFNTVIIDETIFPSLADEFTIDTDMLNMLIDGNYIQGAALEALMSLIETSKSHLINDRTIKEMLGGLDIRPGRQSLDDYGAELFERAIIDEAIEEPLMSNTVDLLVQWSRSGFVGFDIDKGKLCIPITHRLNLKQYDTVCLLDATGTALSMRALLGEQASVVHANTKSNIKVIRYDFNFTHKDIEKCAYNAGLFNFIANQHTQAVIFTSKALNPNEDTHQTNEHQQLVRDHLTGRHVAHFKSAQSRGSNVFKDESSILLMSYFEPQRIIRVAARRLMNMNPNLTWMEAVQDARYRHNGAEMIQAAYRIRPNEHETKTVVYMLDHDLPGLEADTVISRKDIERQYFDATGEMPYHGYDSVVAQLKAIIKTMPHGWRCERDFISLIQLGGGEEQIAYSIGTANSKTQSTLTPRQANLLNKIKGLFEAHCEKSWTTLASILELPFVSFIPPTGGGGVFILGASVTNGDELIELLGKHGMDGHDYVWWMNKRIDLKPQTPLSFGDLTTEQAATFKSADWVNWIRQVQGVGRDRAREVLRQHGGVAEIKQTALEAIEEKEAVQAESASIERPSIPCWSHLQRWQRWRGHSSSEVVHTESNLAQCVEHWLYIGQSLTQNMPSVRF